MARLKPTAGDVHGAVRELAEYAGEQDQQVRAVLDRLRKHTGAIDAIRAIAKNTGEVRQLLELCLQAFWGLREYRQILLAEREAARRLDRYRESVEALKDFVQEVSKPNYHPLRNWSAIPETEQERINRVRFVNECTVWLWTPASASFYRHALDCIDALIEQRRQAAATAPADLVVSRQAATLDAAIKSVIGWLAEQVTQTFGKPHTRHVAILAGVALDIGEVSEKRVHAALAARKNTPNSTRK